MNESADKRSGASMTKAGARRTKRSAKKAAVRKKATRKAPAKARKATAKVSSAESKDAETVNPSEIDALLPEGKLYYRIGEVAKITHVKPHVLRYWETEFRWMAPPKSRSRQRLYRRKDIETILLIKRLLYDERYTIAGARQRLRELGLAKALEGSGEPKNSTRARKTTSPQKSSKAAKAPSREAADSQAAAMLELRTGYRKIRSELQGLREAL